MIRCSVGWRLKEKRERDWIAPLQTCARLFSASHLPTTSPQTKLHSSPQHLPYIANINSWKCSRIAVIVHNNKPCWPVRVLHFCGYLTVVKDLPANQTKKNPPFHDHRLWSCWSCFRRKFQINYVSVLLTLSAVSLRFMYSPGPARQSCVTVKILSPWSNDT